MTVRTFYNLADEIDHLVTTLSAERRIPARTGGQAPIDRLSGLEDAIRPFAAGRQTLQKIASARRLLGDEAEPARYRRPFILE